LANRGWFSNLFPSRIEEKKMISSTTGVALGPDVQGSHFLDATALQWQPTDTPGFDIVTLFENPFTGESTAMMRVEPGAGTGAHSHALFEEIYVLEGDFSDEERTYLRGQYCVRSPGTLHTAASERGCVVMLIYRSTAAASP
jgi:quercetin dioxygenase-like cupin family protein